MVPTPTRVHHCTIEEGWAGIVSALTTASAGDEVRLGDGEYSGEVPMVLPPGVALVAAGAVTLTCQAPAAVISISGSGARVEGLAFRALVAEQVLLDITDASDVCVQRCRFDGAGLAKNGVAVRRSRGVLLSSCRVEGCARTDAPLSANVLFLSSSGVVDDGEFVGGRRGVQCARDAQSTHVPSEVTLVGNRCHDNQGEGIAFFSSTGRAEGNECWGSRESGGIAVQREPTSPDAASDVALVNNRCHDNLGEGIAFFSSTGRAEGNECWGSRECGGIVVQRDANSPDAASDVALVGNRCHDNSQAGIAFFSSTGQVEDNECWGSREGCGIVVQRDAISPDAASDVALVGNRCHDNQRTGIVFLSSTGRAEGNECWGSREGGGIFVLRDPTSPDAASDVTLVGNSCHDNHLAGIAFLSSTGRAEGNECWGSREGGGIFVQRDPASPDAASDVTLVGNRCHDNQWAGIAFFSSTGRAEGNESWGSRLGGGIGVGRDPKSPDAASDVALVGNRCYDNHEAGVEFFSSTGRAEGNECWGSCEGGGIAVGRDAASPGAASDVALVGNRCHDNHAEGIAFFSSTGQAEGNECWGGREGGGMAILRDQKSPDAASDVALVGNRCYDNHEAGVMFLSSTGRAEGNECWGSREGGGIAVGRDAESPDAASDVTLVGNRCHDNLQSGIAFFSSTGRAEGNECWGSCAGSGILVQRASYSPDAASAVTLVGNRCYDNHESGITFHSSTGRAEGNECWGNRESSGILVQRDGASPDAASDVTLVGNRCHDNLQSGIAFLSSTGRAEGNECWGSRARGGIHVQRDPRSPEAASAVTLVGNYCHDNHLAGIAFLSSTGRAEGNECWLNTLNEVHVEGDGRPHVAAHHTYAGLPIGGAWRAYLKSQPLGAWLWRTATAQDRRLALGQFLSSGACRRCFERFWTGSTAHPPATPASMARHAPESPAAHVEAGTRAAAVYSVQHPNGRVDDIRRAAGDDTPGAAIAHGAGLAALSSLMRRFARQYDEAFSRPTSGPRPEPPRWTIGMVSADVERFEAWLPAPRSRQRVPWRSRWVRRPGGASGDVLFRVVDLTLPPLVHPPAMAARRTSRRRPRTPGIVEHSRLARVSRLERWRVGAAAVVLMPASEAVLNACVLSLALVASVRAVASEVGVVAPSPPSPFDRASWVDVGQALAGLGAVVVTGAGSHKAFLAAMAVGWVLLLVLLVNRLLPPQLGQTVDLHLDVLEALGLNGLKRLARSLRTQHPRPNRWGRVLRWLGRSEASRRLWVRRQIYGYRLFGMAWRRRPPAPVLVVLRDVDMPGPDYGRELREILALCPRHQSVCVVTQMSGLSMLTSAYLDVWFPRAEEAPHILAETVDAYVVHDATSVRLDAVAPPRVQPVHHDAATRDATAIATLGRILGWSESDTHTRRAWANELLAEPLRASSLLPAVVLGSTPHAYMQVEYDNLTHLLADTVLPAVRDGFAVFGVDEDGARAALEGEVLTNLRRCVSDAVGLLLVEAGQKQRWVGRGGYRRSVGVALRDVFAASDVPEPRAQAFVSRLLAIGERFHLAAAASRLGPRCGPHIEAALFLAQERRALAPSFVEWPGVAEAWTATSASLNSAASGSFEPEHAVRACAAAQRGLELYAMVGDVSQCSSRRAALWQAAIDDPLTEPPDDVDGAWRVCLDQLRLFVRMLARREPGTAAKLLAARLAEDWSLLPDAWQRALRERLTTLPAWWLSRLNRTTTAEELLAVATEQREQPGLVVFAVAVLAAARWHRRPAGTDAKASPGSGDEATVAAADALLRLHDAVDSHQLANPLPPFNPAPDSAAVDAAVQLLRHEDHITQLCNALAQGQMSAQNLAHRADTVRSAIEGIALGAHGKLHGVLLAADAEDVSLKFVEVPRTAP